MLVVKAPLPSTRRLFLLQAVHGGCECGPVQAVTHAELGFLAEEELHEGVSGGDAAAGVEQRMVPWVSDELLDEDLAAHGVNGSQVRCRPQKTIPQQAVHPRRQQRRQGTARGSAVTGGGAVDRLSHRLRAAFPPIRLVADQRANATFRGQKTI